MTCPHCDNSVPVMAFWQATGLSGTVCPHCNSSLQPTHWRSAVLFILAGLAGNCEGSLVRDAGYGGGLAILGVVVTVFVVYAGLAPFLLRFRVKEDAVLPLPHSNS